MSNEDCIFCKIVNKEMQTEILFENDDCIAFNDIRPASPTHILVIPKKHYKNLIEIKDTETLGKLFKTVQDVAKKIGVAEEGFRTVVNTGDNGGQTVYHVHVHILAGRFHKWPPG